mgnify:FL=1
MTKCDNNEKSGLRFMTGGINQWQQQQSAVTVIELKYPADTM